MSVDTRVKIQNALKDFSSGNLFDNSINLFKALGYNTERQSKLSRNSYQGLIEDIPIAGQILNVSKAQTANWISIDLLFQLTQAEMSHQSFIFDTGKVDNTIIEAYLFFAIELKQLENAEYSRTHLSDITRELNKVFSMPVMILFKYGDFLTFSVIKRRLHKRNGSKDVLEQVTSIKDINFIKPHRAHIEIFFDLSIEKLRSDYECRNFVDLHNAWQKIFDTKELNKRFYNELFNWYLWAVRSVKFPNDVENDRDDTVYNSESVIRLLTRLIFVWFIKEKGLVPNKLFDEKELTLVLKDFNPQSIDNSIYYRAILQNLFFATLNTPMDKDVDNQESRRRFINTFPKTGNDQYLDQTKYRYQDYFNKPNEALSMFASIPFFNGGLFECLDFKEGGKEIRYDGFSSTKGRQAFVPDKLFFSEKNIYDLNSDYGTKGKIYRVEGLLNILNSYKFTITENTPLDEEIALDPELLGKVFENLLASYNPETRTTARKKTGSYYTPREIVHYMVDEALIAYLKQKIGDIPENEVKLRQLFDYTDNQHPFNETEADLLVKAISEAKILDPACGSGAFPMGVLQRMVDLLTKIDVNNERWKKLQRNRAIAETTEIYNSDDNSKERLFRLSEIDKAFDLNINYPGYARKLFLIENCIYGIDIQQIAVQISKLRIFISLIVDQKVDDNKPNRNILSMPNLETKFVAANTLIGLDKPQQLSLMTDEVKQLEKELIGIRHKIFFTRKYYDKKELKLKDKAKREELQAALERSGYKKNTAAQMASWNPFDPISSASFFDSETMFSFGDGFDIVIGNPPFVDIKSLPKEDVKKYFKIFNTTENRINLYSIFIEKGYDLISNNGIILYINPNSILLNESYKKIRNYIIDGVEKIIKLPDSVFIEATVETIILITRKRSNSEIIQGVYFKNDDLIDFKALRFETFNRNQWKLDPDVRFNIFTDSTINNLVQLIENHSEPLEKYLISSLGITPYDKYKGHSEKIINNREFHSKVKVSETYVPLISGKNIYCYYISDEIEEYLNYGNWLGAPREEKFFTEPKIVVRQILSGDNLKIIAAYSDRPHYFTQVGFSLISKHKNLEDLKFIVAILNSKLMSFYHKAKFLDTQKNVFPKILIANCKRFPIRNVNKRNSFIRIVDYIILHKKKNIDTVFFERLIDAMVYELYFQDEIKEGGAEVLKYLENLPELSEVEDERNIKIIERVYRELSDPLHPISAALLKLLTIEVVNIIEGRK